jgi:CRISPR system Cascade subunit CasD
MPTLLLRLSAPMQAWRVQQQYTHRVTETEPSKSGVVGLLCAALGRARHEPIEDLASLRMGVRIDQAGVVKRDFHTAGMGGMYKVSGGVGKNLMPSDRYYLSDAKFLVGLEGEQPLLEQLQRALQNPVWFLGLGSKAFIPGEHIWLQDGLRYEETLEQALESYPWLGYGEDKPDKLRIMMDDPQGTFIRNDQPVSFAPRRFLPRTMKQYSVDMTVLSDNLEVD